ncbi:hypothetical protein [Sporichthya sp.]|uniref:hypothetical protein n=1 Tax=Sporichthya sp. TaxID=65475 RepID=UPI0017CAC07A|nr:hypothetical protein [Sporichthya sp.]MBA3745220.1 hypothetical protein [Sporichthya sp.]
MAEARTLEELNVCWVNKAPGEWLDLEVVVDGPSFKTASLDNGDCMAWDVRPGQYKLTLEDLDEFQAAMQAACGRGLERRLTIFLKRQQDTYKTDFRVLRDGGVLTNIRKDRRTTVTFVLKCVPMKDNP